MYHVSAQGVDEHMINVHYYYYQSIHRQFFHMIHMLVARCEKSAEWFAQHFLSGLPWKLDATNALALHATGLSMLKILQPLKSIQE